MTAHEAFWALAVFVAFTGTLLCIAICYRLWQRVRRWFAAEGHRMRRRELKRLRAMQRGRQAQARMCAAQDVQ